MSEDSLLITATMWPDPTIQKYNLTASPRTHEPRTRGGEVCESYNAQTTTGTTPFHDSMRSVHAVH
jgi:hypothetical protein